MGKAFVTNMESRAKMNKEFKASAKQLGLLSRPRQKLRASDTDTECYQFKPPFNPAFCSDSVSPRGRGSFHGIFSETPVFTQLYQVWRESFPILELHRRTVSFDGRVGNSVPLPETFGPNGSLP